MAFIRTLRGPARGRQPTFRPRQSRLCRCPPLTALSASVRRADPPSSPGLTDQLLDPARDEGAASAADDRP